MCRQRLDLPRQAHEHELRLGPVQRHPGRSRLDEANPGKSQFDFTVKTDSIDTANAKRDATSRTPTSSTPSSSRRSRFKSKTVGPAGKDTFEVTGDLTLHGVTKPVTVKIAPGRAQQGPRGTDRRDRVELHDQAERLRHEGDGRRGGRRREDHALVRGRREMTVRRPSGPPMTVLGFVRGARRARRRGSSRATATGLTVSLTSNGALLWPAAGLAVGLGLGLRPRPCDGPGMVLGDEAERRLGELQTWTKEGGTFPLLPRGCLRLGRLARHGGDARRRP